jgi:hypothetical protein
VVSLARCVLQAKLCTGLSFAARRQAVDRHHLYVIGVNLVREMLSAFQLIVESTATLESNSSH